MGRQASFPTGTVGPRVGIFLSPLNTNDGFYLSPLNTNDGFYFSYMDTQGGLVYLTNLTIMIGSCFPVNHKVQTMFTQGPNFVCTHFDTR